jgi:hypothetical protein
MASFTDAISTFNPYVQQLPVDAMVKVGMYKQQKYDEGVQKIQGYIDNVAGLDVAKGPQKEYLQSKLNQLGSNLKNVAAGDFSNQQLVNSVGGMATQLIKDPIIQNAVSSTQHLRKGQAELEEAKKAGKSDKNNENKFLSEASAWLNDGSAESSFQGAYVPYTNIMKIIGDDLANIGEDSRIAENILMMENGKPKEFPVMELNPKTGKMEAVPGRFEYHYADVKTIEKLTSNKEAVLGVINNALKRGDVQQQLKIDGWANYKDTPVEPLVGKLITQHEETDARNEQDRLNIVKLLDAKNLSNEQRAAYSKQLNELELNKVDNDKEFAQTYEFAFKNPEAFKQSLYESEYKNNIFKRFLKENKEFKFGANEGRAQQDKDKDYLFDVLKENNRIADSNRDYLLDVASNTRAEQEHQAKFYIDPKTGEWRERAKPGDEINPSDIVFSTSAPGAKPAEDYAINTVAQKIDGLSKGKEKVSFDLFAEYTRKLNNNSKMTDKEVEASLNKLSKASGKPRNEYLYDWTTDLQNEYIEKGLVPPNNLNQQLNAYNTLADELDNEKYLSAKTQEAVIKKLEKAFPKVKLPNGAVAEVNIEDQNLFLLAWGGSSNVNFRNSPKTNIGAAHQKLIQKYGPNYHTILAPSLGYTGQNVSKNRVEYNKAWEEELRKYVSANDATDGSLPLDSKNKANTISIVNQYLDSAQGMRKLGPDTDLATIKEALNEPTAINWKATKPRTAAEDWKGTIMVTDKKGGVHTIEDVNPNDLGQLTGKTFGEYQSTPIENIITYNENTHSTNKDGFVTDPTAWKSAYFKENKLLHPSAQNSDYRFRADAIKTPSGYQMVYYIKPPTSDKFELIYGDTYTDEHTLEKIYRGATADMIKNQYAQHLQSLKKDK